MTLKINELESSLKAMQEEKDNNETENYLENIDFINNNSTNCDALEENNSSAWDTFDDINRNSVIRSIY